MVSVSLKLTPEKWVNKLPTNSLINEDAVPNSKILSKVKKSEQKGAVNLEEKDEDAFS